MAINTKNDGDQLSGSDWSQVVDTVTNTTIGHDHDGTDSKKLDWDNIWSDAVHNHSSAGEGGATINPTLAIVTNQELAGSIELAEYVKHQGDTDTFIKFQIGSISLDSDGTTQLIADSAGIKLQSGSYVTEFSTDSTLTGDSDSAVPTEKAMKAYCLGSVIGRLGTGSSGVRNNNLSGTDFVASEQVDSDDLNDTFDTVVSNIREGNAVSIAQTAMEIIEIKASNTSTYEHGVSYVTDTFSDSTGYSNTVDTESTDATFSSNKYIRQNYLNLHALYYFKFDGDLTEEVTSEDLSVANGTPTTDGTAKVGTFSIDFEANNTERVANTTINLVAAKTVDFWIKPETVAASRIMSIQNDAVNDYSLIRILDTDKIEVQGRNIGVATWTLTSTTSAQAGTWMHIIVVSGTGGAKLYINGNTTPEDTDANTTILGIGDNLHIGASSSNGAPYDGLVDNLLITDEEYTTTQVTDSYNSGNGLDFTDDSLETIQEIVITIPTIIGTVKGTLLMIRDPDRESGDIINYDLKDASSNEDLTLAVDTVNLFSNLVSNPTQLRINLIPTASSATNGIPSIRSYCLYVFKDR